MANPELIEYAKNQLDAGSSATYVRTVLIKQGWSERDVDDAIGIAQAQVEPKQPPAPVASPVAEAKPSGSSKFLAIAGTLSGIFFIVMGGISIYILITLGGALAAFEALAAAGGAAGVTGMFSGYIWLGWIFAVIELLAGIFWIIFGIKELT